MSTHPEVLWAQRSSDVAPDKNVIYLTINLPDIKESTLEYALTATNLSFKARTSHEQTYEFNLDLFAEIDVEQSRRRLTSRSLVAVLRKKELKSEYWPRLTKEKLKTPFIKTDFEKWVDEDEQDGNPAVDDEFADAGGMPGMGSDFDFSKLGDFGAGDAQPGVEEVHDDSDDDGPPPLEEPEPSK